MQIQRQRIVVFLAWQSFTAACFVSNYVQAAAVDYSKFESYARQLAEKLRSLPAYTNPYCYLDAIVVGNTIIRTSDRVAGDLKPGDKIIAINERTVDADDANSLFTIIKDHGASDSITISVRRRNNVVKHQVKCESSKARLASRIDMFDAAAEGDFSKCYTKAKDENKFLIRAITFYVQTRCGKYSDQYSDPQIAVRMVQYWGIVFDDLKGQSNPIEAAQKIRPSVLGDVTWLETNGQGRLGAELNRMLAVASGIPATVPPPAMQRNVPSSPVVGRTAPAARPPRPAFGPSGCESDHWIESVTDDGEIVKLEDGSIWQVDAGDTVDAALWLPATEITVCDGKLINTDDNEKVGATRIR